MGLKEEILAQSSQIHTDSYAMSIGELVNLYKDDELYLHPEFQRVYRWTDTQKSKLIESLLLGIPIPPVFVAQRGDGVWDVIDGQQRLSTIFQLMGILRDEDNDLVPALVLNKTRFLPSMEGKSWGGEKALSRDQQLWVKRSRIDVNIVLKESDTQSRYELFMRLNTGGTPLTEQEIRNCLMLMAYPGLYEWIDELGKNQHFIDSIAVSERLRSEQYPMELATRFLIFRTFPDDKLKEVADIGDFLTDQLARIHSLSPEERKAEGRAFSATFEMIVDEIGENSFRKYDDLDKRFKGGFSISAFEAISYGIGFHAGKNGKPKVSDKVLEKVQSLWANPTFANNSGSGVRASTRIPKIVPMARKLFAK